tara:strand:+ start:64 stop:846 length:783 start_codon:yes stop_codon:yes gene_type:complete
MKKLGLIIFGMFIISMSLVFVSAGPADRLIEGARGLGESVFELTKPLLEIIVGETANGETFFAKILFLIIIFAIVWKSIEKIDFFKENDWVLWTVSIAVSILAIRWLGNSEVVYSMILPYSVLGIFISAGLPFVLAFLIIEDLRKTMRKFAWIFFAVIFIGLWFSRNDEIGNFGWIYLMTAVLAIVMIIMDGTIQRFWKKMKFEAKFSYEKMERVQRLRDDIDKVKDLRIKTAATATIPQKKRLDQRIKLLEDELIRISS